MSWIQNCKFLKTLAARAKIKKSKKCCHVLHTGHPPTQFFRPPRVQAGALACFLQNYGFRFQKFELGEIL